MKIAWGIHDKSAMEAEDFRHQLRAILPDVSMEAIERLPVNPVIMAMAYRGVGLDRLVAKAEEVHRSTMLLMELYQEASPTDMQALLGKAESPEDLTLLAELAGQGVPFEVLLSTPLDALRWIRGANIISNAFNQVVASAAEIVEQIMTALGPTLNGVEGLLGEDPVTKARQISKKDLDKKRKSMRGKRRLL